MQAEGNREGCLASPGDTHRLVGVGGGGGAELDAPFGEWGGA